MKDIEYTADYIVEQRAMFGNVSLLYLFCKRAFDVTASFIAVILLLPLFLIVIILIKADSPGPAFFNQKRSGFKGKAFNMYKFRSMVNDAEDRFKELEDKNEISGNMFKIRNDPRVTGFGKILRKTSIDELPQLFNVIKGDMSIVGPRPPIGREVRKYDAWHNLRLSVKPGITGLWQVSGRNELGFEDMCRLDLKYIRERGFLYDMKIIIKTIPVLLGDKRAS
ncbi:lipopolysaccharide/colanic/teichoic acid biosynthesis glycosyltransferase [Ruminiclostridium sufflavum DSM 19573]|uniref:Lipopolysaccharide/colanic/teichoic acid biosynthesis glycosyltransferase n=1 Tax=Ruminiclostridium sufflavum DSM 19573 TaxID=1121337 RepID=A0A318XNY7_9FIRM|nr:sugar transferase [Ruminiclostridium sufflavum]PYG89476.1 lipopolysaccharide/colanic/teichoic acid biosynthesis glycosyltransferase [Ruminiclostridium sufflavum DSM 19573]